MPNPRLDLSGGVWRWAVVIGGGILASTLAQSGTLDLPIRNLLTSKFEVAKLDPCVEATGSLHTISEFFAIAAFPWYLKFIVGVFSDSVPLLGTMRRHYVLLSATAAAILWLLAGQIQYSYLSLLAVITAMETMLVVCSTVTGALLVEVGQRLDAAGRLVAARIFVEGICSVVAGPLAGALAGVCARLGADVDRYSFNVRDLHPLLLAGLPAHIGFVLLVANAWQLGPYRQPRPLQRNGKGPPIMAGDKRSA